MSVLAKVLQQSEKTFLTINKESLKSNLQVLKSLVESLDLNDLQIDSRFVSKQEFQRKVEFVAAGNNIRNISTLFYR